ncbi:MAG: YncE family protein [Bacillus sp. (in: firmicutes)]|uniref:40-residue YVTN family beta-propeller n=1 Tax=Sutcliffiella cohnii TaxID=33932 RepID=A0A223KQT6_9BACI|nr:40-residue YVTN family beta-propeller [Sutcliffiella cohnii]
MNKVKASLFIFLLIIGLVLAGCSNNNNQDGATDEQTKTQNQTSDSTSEKEGITDQNVIKYYFTADEGGSITKINANTNQVDSTIEVDGMAHNVQVSSDGEMLAATVVPNMDHGDDDSMNMDMPGTALFLNTATNEVVNTVEVGNHPAHIVFTENGKYVLVTNNEDDTVSVIDTSTFKVVNTISTGNRPHGFRITADSSTAYIANMGEDTVSVINLKTMKEDKKIKVGSAPVTTGITSDGKTLIATLNAENALAIVNLENEQVDKIPVGNGPAQVYLDSNNEFAYVANQGTEKNPSNSITVVDIIAKKETATIETGKGSHGVVTSPDNKRVYVTNMFDHTVSVVDTEQNKVIETIEVGETPNGISVME